MTLSFRPPLESKSTLWACDEARSCSSLARSMSDDPEQSVQVEATPALARQVLAVQTPLLSRFLGAGAPSPAVSLRNFGRTRGPPRTPHLLHFRAEAGGDPEDCIEEVDCMEEEAGPEDQAQEP